MPNASAQLVWGAGGNGGAGTWNATNTNWWNGTSNVIWNNGAAVFAGTGGMVTASFSMTATALTFNAPGYTLQSGSVNPSVPSLTVTTNQAATINSFLNASTLVKGGPATLTVGGSNSIHNLQINAGEYRISGFSSPSFLTTTLANAPGVTLTLGQTIPSAFLRALSGGGTSGGILRPDTQDRTVTVFIDYSGNFGGVMQDNGSGKLAVDFGMGSALRSISGGDVLVRRTPTTLGTQTLTNASTYSGPTNVSVGTVHFSGNGSALNSAMTVSTFGTLRLDSSATANGNRLSNTLDLTIKGGRLEFIGHGATAIEEQAGLLKFSGATTVSATPSGAAASLTFSGASRQNHGTLDFLGTGRVKWTGMANNSAGIVGSHLTAGDDWATVGGDGSASPLTSYATNLNTAASTAHVKLTGGAALSTTATRATLNFQNPSGTTSTLNLGAANILTLSEGGLLTSGNAASIIQNGTLRSGGAELVVINRNALTIASSIGESVTGTVLTKSGAGALTLSGGNSYSGNTIINQGTLTVSADAHLGTGTTIEFNGGNLRAAGSFTSTKGFTRGTELTGTIDTAGFDIVFSGTNNGDITKTGAGTLTLTHLAKGRAFLSAGTLDLPNAASGEITNEGGTLRASGTLTKINNSTNAILDIGGPVPATLAVGSFFGDVNAATILFDMGTVTRDLLSVTGSLADGSATDPLFFDFRDLGDTATGVSYTILTLPAAASPSPSAFVIAPTAAAAGWAGTFSVIPGAVQVTFASVPEPSSLSSLALLSLGLFRLRRRPAVQGSTG